MTSKATVVRHEQRPHGPRSERDRVSEPGQPHYFSPRPHATSRPASVHLALPDLDLDLATDRGVFSGGRIDPGTKILLLEGPAPPATGDLLDLGCGYGPIALALATRSPGATVWAVDVNERARDLTRANAEAAGLANVKAVAPDDVPPDVCFAAIWSNPPVRVGKTALHDLLDRWLARLSDEGRALLVVQKHLGSDSLHRWLAQRGWQVERRASRMAYRVLDVRRASGDATPPPPDTGGTP
jgi:16S rRNA (guanine1207-N2)-methyltransferase